MTKKPHAFNFPGGEQLSTIGASFFVSYLYSQYVEPAHSNWKSIATKDSRVSTITRSKQHHRVWLECVGQMSDKNLSTNTLGLPGEKVKVMARSILEVIG